MLIGMVQRQEIIDRHQRLVLYYFADTAFLLIKAQLKASSEDFMWV